MKRTISFCFLASFALVLWAALRAPGWARIDRPPSRYPTLVLNALDHCLNIFDLRNGSPGRSRQIDAEYREYLGDVFFTGKSLIALENDRFTGHFVDLGEETEHTEFAPFHALRIDKRSFQTLQFPFASRFIPYTGLDSRKFLGNVREPNTTIQLAVGHTYALRLFQHTTFLDERVFLLKVIDLRPGVEVKILWRELSIS